MIRQILIGAAAGLISGALVGLTEALLILSAAAQVTEYVAFFYAAVLYGVVGAGMGAAAGLIFLPWRTVGEAWRYTLCFLLVGCGLSGFVARAMASLYLYNAEPLPRGAELVIAGGVALQALFTLWLGPIFLTRTPFKILLKTRGTAALYGAMAVLSAVFSFAPGRGDPLGTTNPDRPSSLPDETPSALLILVGGLRADRLGAYHYSPPGMPEFTPHIDALAEESVVFERAYASSSWIGASSASLLSSAAPSAHGVLGVATALPEEVETFPEVVAEKGYVTGALTNNIHLSRSYNFQQGFDYFHYMVPDHILWATETASHLALYSGLSHLYSRYSGEGWQERRLWRPSSELLSEARGFVSAQRRGRPWFLLIHLMEPRRAELSWSGTELPDEAQLRQMEVEYAQAVKEIDDELGLFFAWLKGEGYYDNTVIALTSDHGLEFWEHGGLGSGATLYDEVLHIPLMIKLPGAQYGGLRVPWQVRQVDVAPTLAARAGIVPPGIWQGRDLLDPSFVGGLAALARIPEDRGGPEQALGARPPIYPQDRPVFAEQSVGRGILSAVQTMGWKLVKASPENRRGLAATELYRISQDPEERENLAGAYPEKQTELEQLLIAQIKEASRARVRTASSEMDETTRARLQALGYME